MGILLNSGDTSSRSEQANSEGSKLRVLTGASRETRQILLGSRTRGETGHRDVHREADTAWHVTLKVRSSLVQGVEDLPPGLLLGGTDGLGVLEQTCFVQRPCVQVRRPETMAILHVLSDGGWSWWNGGLPEGWTELEISISSSRDFCSEVGVKYGGYLRRDIRSAMSRDELPHANVLGARHEIVRKFLTPGDIRATIEFVFETEPCKGRGGSGHVEDGAELDWKLIDIVLIAMAPEGSAARPNNNIPGPHCNDSSGSDDLQ